MFALLLLGANWEHGRFRGGGCRSAHGVSLDVANVNLQELTLTLSNGGPSD